MSAESRRLGGDREAGAWRAWGPYLSERAWGTVREDYSPGGTAWDYLPHDHARSRAYRWSEDGLAGLCDLRQRLCLALALWNERDPILKERIFGLTGEEGNHGEDAKEYWWYLDALPSHAWLRWRMHYAQGAFPYGELVAENRRRGRAEPEYELVDTGIFDGDRYFAVTVDYAKAGPEDLLMRITVRNHGPEAAALRVLPTLWFRNTWSWAPGSARPELGLDPDGGILARHHGLGDYRLTAAPGPDGQAPEALFCENETNFPRLFGGAAATPWPKDGIGDHLVHGAATVNPAHRGTKAAFHYRLQVPAGGEVELRLRLARPTDAAPDLERGFARTMRQREREADAFYTERAPDGADAQDRATMRQAFAGMLWSKQFYHYDVARWLDGDPGEPPPPASRKRGRNAGWRHLNNRDVISMPDKWEYPWYAAWDLAFHTVALAHVDPGFAKHQLTLLCREWYMHPSGQLPAYEWAFGDVNPPVHAWAARRVFELDGRRDRAFLERVFHKLLLNFTWWVNRKDASGNNVFEGGFLGLDNIGPFDRSQPLPGDGWLEQSDGTAWMAMYALDLLDIALVLAEKDPVYEDVATKFFEHFAYIASAMNAQGLWDEDDGFYYDVWRHGDGSVTPVRGRSMVGLVPLFAVAVLDGAAVDRLPDFARRMAWFVGNKPEYGGVVAHCDTGGGTDRRLMSIVSPERLRRILARVLDEDEFLSPHGVRALSRHHRDHPLEVRLGGTTARLDYEPGESTTGLFGGNSNWRGPVWMPVNFLLIEGLRRFHRYLGDDFRVECPTGSGKLATLAEVADELARRLVSLFRDDASGRRPVFGGYEKFQADPAWHDLLLFHEYFHGDTGAGLGAMHQTGWTGLVADLIAGRR